MQCSDFVIEVENPSDITIETTSNTLATVEVQVEPEIAVVEVEVRGLQGASSVERPLDYDPLEIYLQSRGDINGGNS